MRNTGSFFFFFKKKKETVKTERIQKNHVFVEKIGVWKNEKIKKCRKRIIKSKGIFSPNKKSKRTIKMKSQRRNRCSRKRTKKDHVQKHRRIKTKKKNFVFEQKDREKGQTCKNEENLWKCPTKK